MVYAIKTTKEVKQQKIKEELVYQAKDIFSNVIDEHEHKCGCKYSTCLDKYHEMAAKNIDEWDALTWSINSVEYDLEHTDYRPDAEAGNPCPEWEALYQKLEDLREEAEEWALTFEEMFEDFWVKLEEAVYGEEG